MFNFTMKDFSKQNNQGASPTEENRNSVLYKDTQVTAAESSILNGKEDGRLDLTVSGSKTIRGD